MRFQPHLTTFPKLIMLIAGVSVLVLGAAKAGDAEVIHRQAFSNNTGSFLQSGSYGWQWYFRDTAIEGTNLNNRIHFQSGADADPSINAPTPHGDGIMQGFWVINSSDDQLGFTNINLPAHRYRELSFSMHLRGPPSAEWRFAFLVGTRWYVSGEAFAPTASWVLYSFALDDNSTLFPLAFIPGSQLPRPVGDVVTWSAIRDNIHAAGFFAVGAGTTDRMDNFSISGIDQRLHFEEEIRAASLAEPHEWRSPDLPGEPSFLTVGFEVAITDETAGTMTFRAGGDAVAYERDLGLPDGFRGNVPVQVSVNHTGDPVDYPGTGLSIAAHSLDVWIDGERVVAGHPSVKAGESLRYVSLTWAGENPAFPDIDNLFIDAAPGTVFASPLRNLYMSADGDDAHDGRSPETPVRSLGRIQGILQQFDPRNDVHVHIAPGLYQNQRVVWTHVIPDGRIVFQAEAGAESMPVFDGRDPDTGRVPSGSMLSLSRSDGVYSRLEFRGLRIQNYLTAFSFNGNRDDLGGFNARNVIEGCYFYRIGNIADPEAARSTAVIRLLNSKENRIVNNDFVDIVNTVSGGLIHAIYAAHYSDENIIARNRFVNNSGDAVRIRDFSLNNDIYDNVFVRAGSAGYSDWFCNADIRDDCTKPTPECHSWENHFFDNILVSSFGGGSINEVALYQQHPQVEGCQPPFEGAQRVIAFDNVTLQEFPAYEHYRHRHFDPEQRADEALSGPDGDANGDGISNHTKFVLGLSPHVPVDFNPLTMFSGGGDFSLSWRLQPGRTYRLQRSVDLVAWQVVDEADSGVGNLHTFQHQGDGTTAFYRLRVSLAD